MTNPPYKTKIQANIEGGVTDTGYVIFEKKKKKRFPSYHLIENDPHPPELILHLFGQLVRIEDARNRHLDFALFILSFPQLSFSFFKVKVTVIITSEFLQRIPSR